MSDTIILLRRKARQLINKLRSLGVKLPKRRELDFFALSIGEHSWEKLTLRHKAQPRPYTDYQLSVTDLAREAGIGIDQAASIVIEFQWATEYVPVFNKFPLRNDGDIIVPDVICGSHLFSLRRKREKDCLRKRIGYFGGHTPLNLDRILFTGETLNIYDETVFYLLLSYHPAGTPVGRQFRVEQNQIEETLGRNISPLSFEASLLRMQNCLVEIFTAKGDLLFCGPLIYSFKRLPPSVPRKAAYSIKLNQELTRLYLDPSYADIMEIGGLFRASLRNLTVPAGYNLSEEVKRMDQLAECNFAEYDRRLRDPWPTMEADIIALRAILQWRAVNGSVTFKLLEWAELGVDGDLSVELPQWQWDALAHYRDLYGNDAGSLIFKKVLATVFCSPARNAA